MFCLNLVQVIALQSPPAVLSFIAKDLNNTADQTWVPNALSLVQAVIAPLLASISDTFQAGKSILVGCSAISFIGAVIAPGSSSIYRLIGAQVLIGFGFATTPLGYTVPSEILPRKWRPMAQAAMNIAAALGAIVGPLAIGALTRDNAHTGWRTFYWIQMALWGAVTIGLLVGYRPPKRHTRLDYLKFWQKIARLDIPGFFLLTAGLTLFLVGLNFGGNGYAWSSAVVLATIIVGLVTLVAFGIFEWKGTKTGILNHGLFSQGKSSAISFSLCLVLIFLEGILLFAYIIFYPVLTNALFETDPFLEVAREQPYWVATALSTVVYGFASTKLCSIRSPPVVGFLIFTAGGVGLATIQPSDSTRAIVFAGLSGIGFGAPLILIIAGVQLATPHHLMGTATAVTTSTRAISATIFTAIYSAAFSQRLNVRLPAYVAKAALTAGLPKTSLPSLIEALAADNTAALQKIPGLTPAVLELSIAALKQAFADSIRVVFIIAAPFGLPGCLLSFFVGDLKSLMNYHVDAPMEDLHAKHKRAKEQAV